MNVLTFYIGKEILKGSLVTLLILLTIFNLFTFADEVKDLKGAYDLKQIFYYITLTSPKVLYELVPSSALIGSLFVLGSMGNNRELIAMQGCRIVRIRHYKSGLAGRFRVSVAVARRRRIYCSGWRKIGAKAQNGGFARKHHNEFQIRRLVTRRF